MNYQLKDLSVTEYILYLWQTEDLLRSLDFDIEKVNAAVITSVAPQHQSELRLWYSEIIDMMLAEGIKDKGHLQIANIRVSELEELHHALLIDVQQTEYAALYYKCLPSITELRQKENNSDAGDIAVCLQFLYGVLLLRLQKRPITDQTQEAMSLIVHLLNSLSRQYNAQKTSENE